MSDDDVARAGPRAFSATEEVATTPGWVEGELDGILGALSATDGIATARSRYLDGLAASRTEVERDRSRHALLRELEGLGVDAGERRAIDTRLLGLEAEISART